MTIDKDIIAEIQQLSDEGMSIRKIAKQLGVSTFSVQKHRNLKEDSEQAEQPEEENADHNQESKFIEAETLCEVVIKHIEKNWMRSRIHISTVLYDQYFPQAKIFERRFEYTLGKLVERDLTAIEFFYEQHEKYKDFDEQYKQQEDNLATRLAAERKAQKLDDDIYSHYRSGGMTERTQKVLLDVKKSLQGGREDAMDKMMKWEMIRDMRHQRESQSLPVPQTPQPQIVQQPQQKMTQRDMMMFMMMPLIAKRMRGGEDELVKIYGMKLLMSKGW